MHAMSLLHAPQHSLQSLNTLELSCTAHVAQPLTPKSISLLALSWPRLSSLSLTVMKRPEFVPESLELLDLFTSLHSLSLFCPLDADTGTITDDDDDDDGAEGESRGYRCLTPINLWHLPPGLTHFRVEQALLHDQHGMSPSLPSNSLPETYPSTHHGLPSLLTLEADTCQIDDEGLLALLGASPGLRLGYGALWHN